MQDQTIKRSTSKKLIIAVEFAEPPAYRICKAAGLNPATWSRLRHGAEAAKENDPRLISIGAQVGVPPEHCFEMVGDLSEMHIAKLLESRPKSHAGLQKKKRSAEDPITPRLFTLTEAAKYSRFSYWTIRDLVISGRLPRVQLPRSFAAVKIKGGSKRNPEKSHHLVRVAVNDGASLRAIRIDRQDLD